jgi:hypothetical protein
MGLIRSNFPTKKDVLPDDTEPDDTLEYEKKAIESIGGSMVFVERKKLLWEKK